MSEKTDEEKQGRKQQCLPFPGGDSSSREWSQSHDVPSLELIDKGSIFIIKLFHILIFYNETLIKDEKPFV